jgi:2',3'-cyclic-nucleotide 2'-phosphodiesterase (5'-nucleotidase family)
MDTTNEIGGKFMHSTSKKLLALLLTLAMVLTMLPTLVFAANEKPAADEVVTIEFLGTSDVHGQLYATDYTADSSTSGTYKRGLTPG